MDNSLNGNVCEIVETKAEIISEFKIDEKPESSGAHKSGEKYGIEDDINSLFRIIDIKNSTTIVNSSGSKESALKRPIKVTPSRASGIGLSEAVNLKQAFRGLCISQASEMAALKRRSKVSSSSKVSEAETIKKLCTPPVELLEFSLVPDKLCSNQISTSTSSSSAHHSTPFVDATNPKTMPNRFPYRNQIVPLPSLEKQVLANSSSVAYPSNQVLELKIRLKTLPATSAKDSLTSSMLDKSMEAKLISASSSDTVNGMDKPTNRNSSLAKPIFENNNFLKEKLKQDLCSSPSCSTQCTRKNGNELASSIGNLNKVTENSDCKDEMKENDKLSLSHSNHSIEVYSVNAGMKSSKPGFCLTGSKRNKFVVTKCDEKSRSKENGEFGQSSKNSIGDDGRSRRMDGKSNVTGHRPHMSKDMRWEAVNVIKQQQGNLNWRHFKLLRKLGCGDIGTVYLAELIGTSCLFALKVVENEFLVSRKKMLRAQTEREILHMLDHPFLPTLYAHIATHKLSCLVMEYCPGGDLHVLRQKQPYKSFSEQATRFYVAEVLLALEYLHMLGIVYRDLKPENILVREDGHIMLTDFDLSFRCCVNPMLVKSSSPTKKMSGSCSQASSCIHPFCLQPNCHVSCFTPILLSGPPKSGKNKCHIGSQVGPLPQLVVEPTNARSNSFVGTYEYLAPEIIKGQGHGSAVDWWTLGIFLFELLYGKTPFKGPTNQHTLANVVSQTLNFPNTPIISFQARDLIRGLLIKDPETRLGSVKGAAEIKQHSFFEGLNWALIRCAAPPELPKCRHFGSSIQSMPSHKDNANDLEDCEEFHLF